MRSIITFVPALACLVGFCLVPMLLMHRNRSSTSHHDAGADEESKEIRRLRAEVSALRSELAQRTRLKSPILEPVRAHLQHGISCPIINFG